MPAAEWTFIGHAGRLQASADVSFSKCFPICNATSRNRFWQGAFGKPAPVQKLPKAGKPWRSAFQHIRNVNYNLLPGPTLAHNPVPHHLTQLKSVYTEFILADYTTSFAIRKGVLCLKYRLFLIFFHKIFTWPSKTSPSKHSGFLCFGEKMVDKAIFLLYYKHKEPTL